MKSLLFFSLLALAGCEDTKRLMSQVETLEIEKREMQARHEDEMERIKVSAIGISDKVDDLNMELVRFRVEDWRNVVPDVVNEAQWAKKHADQLSNYMKSR
jgi:hypothetical protein